MTNLKQIIIGIILLFGGIWFWSYCIGNSFHDLALIRHAQVAMGTLIETREHEAEDARGRVYLSEEGVYRFVVPSGDEFFAKTRTSVNGLEQQEQIEYLADDPTVNRIRGDGSQTVFDFLWRKLGLGILLLILFISPGIGVLRAAWKEKVNEVNTNEHIRDVGQ